MTLSSGTSSSMAAAFLSATESAAAANSNRADCAAAPLTSASCAHSCTSTGGRSQRTRTSPAAFAGDISAPSRQAEATGRSDALWRSVRSRKMHGSKPSHGRASQRRPRDANEDDKEGRSALAAAAAAAASADAARFPALRCLRPARTPRRVRVDMASAAVPASERRGASTVSDSRAATAPPQKCTNETEVAALHCTGNATWQIAARCGI